MATNDVSRRKRVRRGLLIVFVMAGAGAFAAVFFADPRTMRDDDLRLPAPPSLDDPRNGARGLLAALEELPEEWRFALKGFRSEPLVPPLFPLTRESREFLAKFDPLPDPLAHCVASIEAAGRAEWIAFEVFGAERVSDLYFDLVHAMVQLKRARGDWSGVVDCLAEHRDRIRKILEFPSTSHPYWLQLQALGEVGLWEAFLDSASEEDLRRMQDSLSESIVPPRWVENEIRLTYQLLSRDLQDVEQVLESFPRWQSDLPRFALTSTFYRPGRTQRGLVQLVRETLAETPETIDEWDEPVRALGETLPQWVQIATGNAVGAELLQIGLDLRPQRHRRVVARERVLLIALALRRYQKAEGRYPEQLEELVPLWIDRLPNNPEAEDGAFQYDGAARRLGSDDSAGLMWERNRWLMDLPGG